MHICKNCCIFADFLDWQRNVHNYLVIILLVAICFGITDFLTERYPRLQKDISYLSFFTIAFLCTIKYYYGPDVANYAPFYDTVPSIASIWAHPEDIRFHFEPGYAIFCRILKDWGVSFYWMTAIVSILYFGVIGLFLRKIDSKRSFALAILLVLDYNIILYEFRQCLSVVAFLLMILCLSKRKYILTVVCAILAVLFHKAGLMVVVPTLIYYILSYNSTPRAIFAVLLTLLVMLLLLPITHISIDFIGKLPFSHSVIHSIEHHLTYGKQIQSVFIIYAIILLCLVHYTQYCRSRIEIIGAAAITGVIFIVMLYQYYYLLNRIRSYFTPVLLLYIFNYVQKAEKTRHIPYGQLIRQFACFIMVLYMIHIPFSVLRIDKKMHSHVNDTCTVFSFAGKATKEEVQRRQMARARKFWDEDFMKDNTNRINR